VFFRKNPPPLKDFAMTSDITDDIERLARRRAGAKMGWYVHAGLYVLVTLGLVLAALASGRAWRPHALLGWGLGLLVHGFVVFAVAPGGALYEHLLARERRALQQREPW
jgi:hypothetical protein